LQLAEDPEMQNPLLTRWSGPFGGVPPFDRVKVEHFKPALDQGMSEQLAEIERIAGDASAATFENTIAALERSGRTLDRVLRVYNVFATTMLSDAFQAVEREMEPKLAAFDDRIVQNERLFKRISAVYEAREQAGLTPEQQRLAWLKYTDFARSGAKLDAAAKERLCAINQRLASLYTEFSQNVLADEASYVLIDREEDLAGLPESLRSAAAEAAGANGHAGRWAILNTRSSVEPFLTYSAKRGLREKVWRAFVNRGDNGDAHDNKRAIAEIVQLRDERAKLLGYPTHAHWRLEMSMARTPERATGLMQAVWQPAVQRVAEEVADMQAVADAEGAGIVIEP
jgi:peptidyl-dipeptidase Dcp